MADGEQDDAHPVPESPYSSSTFSLTDNIAFKKVERRRRTKRDLIHRIEAKKKALQCAKDETEYRSAGLDLLGAAGLKEKSSPLLPILHVDSHLTSTKEDELMDIQTPCSSETGDLADDEGDFSTSSRLMRDDFDAVHTAAGSFEVISLIFSVSNMLMWKNGMVSDYYCAVRILHQISSVKKEDE